MTEIVVEVLLLEGIVRDDLRKKYWNAWLDH